MQGIESLDNFKKFVSSLGGLGRYEDTYIVHAAEGETVVPMEVLDRNPALKKRLFQSMMDMGIEPGRYIVGNELNSRNPVTGQPEFFLKKIVSQIRKALPGDTEQFLGPIVGLATGNPFLGAIAGGIGSGAEGALTGGLTGLRSPGIGKIGTFGRTRVPFGDIGDKIDPVAFRDLFSTEGLGDFFLGDKGKSGLIGSDGKFLGMGGKEEQLSIGENLDKVSNEIFKMDFNKLNENQQGIISNIFKTAKTGAAKSGMDIMDYITMILIGGGLLSLDKPDDAGQQAQTFTPTGQRLNLVAQGDVPGGPVEFVAQGGVMDLRQGGESEGPGTGTSDDIPAMLSDGEFVMTAKAVRGAGGGDRREGAKKMYQMMDQLEARA